MAINEDCIMFSLRYERDAVKGAGGRFIGQKLYLPYGTLMALLESEELGSIVEKSESFLASIPKEEDASEKLWFFKEDSQEEEEAKAELRARIQRSKKAHKRPKVE